MLALTRLKAGSSVGATPVGGTGGSSEWSGESAAAGPTPTALSASTAAALGGAAPFAPAPAPFSPALAAAAPIRFAAGTGFGDGVGPGGATASGPKPVIVTASAEGGGFGPSSCTGTPAASAAFRPFSTVSITGSSPRNSCNAASIWPTASSPGALAFPSSQGGDGSVAARALQRQNAGRVP